MYEEYEQKRFCIEGHEGIVIYPKKPREDRAYIWRTEFLGAFDYADRELLKKGWFLVYYKISDQFGSPDAVKKMRKFQKYLEETYQLKEKAVLFGFSRGGLYAVNYAATYPQKVWKLYLDAPVLDLFSWPGGFGRGNGSKKDWELCKKIFQITPGTRDCTGNAIHNISTLIKHQIPVLLIAGDSDAVVPFQENGKLLYADYQLADIPIVCIIKKGVGHHPHSLENPKEIVDWVCYDRQYGCIIEQGAKDWQIFQQTNGRAEITLKGRCVDHGSGQSYHAFVRVVEEADGRPLFPWKRCEKQENGWNVVLSVPAGGLYRIETCMDVAECCNEWSKRGDCIHHVGVGDVFAIAGQSNSAGYGKDMITDEQELGIHLLKNNGKWDLASHPMNDSTNTIHPQNRDGANTGQSPYLSFAKYLKRTLGYPIGLIQTALGGSSIRQWSFDEGDLYQNLIDILQRERKVKAILWYQGCTEAMREEADSYGKDFANMVNQIRQDTKDASLPFFTFQLHRFLYACTDEQRRGWGMVREAQRQAAKKLDQVFVIPAMGGTMCDQIHNSALTNLLLGERMAKSVLGHLYRKKIVCDAPDIKRAVKTHKNIILLEFSDVSSQLVWYSEQAKRKIFVVEKDGKMMYPSQCDIVKKNKIKLIFDEVLPNDCVIHGAADSDVICDLPVDFITRLPILAFYGVPVEEV
ncbi:hypothetical protein CE91St58_18330 [Lachnospiraceae bacterium]|nr:hypothetical protein CE91St56_29010 [Lachnospiraceae bacterium]GKH54448.1 hypothetical protein CE91St58_18330 [Lachnospiraceae bacterium]